MSTVTLRIYDLSQGKAHQLSGPLLGKQIDGIWHTGIEVFDFEYYYVGNICRSSVEETPFGMPHSVQELGTTSKTKQQFVEFLSSISAQFSLHRYHLLDNNCNNFSDQCAMFLLSQHIPQHILDLPSEAINSPIGAFLRPIVDQMQAAALQQSEGHQVHFPSEQVPFAQASTSDIVTNGTSSSTNISVYYEQPITLSKGSRVLILRKLHQFDDSFSLEDSPSTDDLLSAAKNLSLDKTYPALDLIRLFALDSLENAQLIVRDIPQLVARFITAKDVPVTSTMMLLRILVNLFAHNSCTVDICEETIAELINESVALSLESTNRSVRKTAALLGLNFAGASRRYSDVCAVCEEHVVRLCYSAVSRLNSTDRPQADEATPLLRMLVVFGSSNADSAQFIAAFGPELSFYNNPDCCQDVETNEAAAELVKLL